MTCTTCGTPNPAGNRFCGQCGASLALACSSCGSPLGADQRFCGQCGAAVVAPPAAATATAPAAQVPIAERRLVSVLFADLVGFTTFSEGRDAEEVRDTLSRYFEIAKDAIGRHGGTIEKFIGDAVMAVWGTPVAREDDAERAVRAGLELLDGVRTLGDGINARAGVLTGEAAVTLGATDQGMVAGDIVNTAARLQSVAAPGIVLAGEATYRAASAAIAFEPAGQHVVKGKEAPIPAWRALRVVAEVGGRRRADTLEAPFTGRDEQLRLLKDLFHATSREGRARLVSVTGPAGIGKSRLAWEFEKYLDGLLETVWWHHGRSPAYSGGVTFWALGEMVRARCGLLEGDDEAHTRAKVAETLATHVPDATERAWVEPAILQLLGVPVPPVSAGELFARWRVLFERLAGSGTVALVFEDLHWADAGTLDFIDHLLDWSKYVPILVLTLSRPELIDARPDWGAGRRSFVSVALDPLPEDDMRALLTGLVPGLPEPAVRGIVARAEGIPLYAVETVRMLVADHRLEERDGVYVPIGEIDHLAVPETLTALIAARLDALEPGDRTLVLDGAVLGQRFSADALAAVAGLDAATLEPRLRVLARRELLTLEVDPRSPERGQYGFVQALIREVAYNTLARRDRKERHLAAARYFETLGTDELASALASHYLAAHANAAAGPEADALAAQARVALKGAAERASALGSFVQAAQFLDQALAVTTQPVDRAELQERLGIAHVHAAMYREAFVPLAEAAALHRERGDAEAEARVLATLGDARNIGKDAAGAARLLESAIERLAALGDHPDLLRMRGQLARSYYLMIRNPDAVRVADELLPAAEAQQLIPVVADTLVTKGGSLSALGRTHEGQALLRAGMQLAADHGLIRLQMRAINNLVVTLEAVDAAEGLRMTMVGLELASRIGDSQWARSFRASAPWVAFRTGAWDFAEQQLRVLLDEVADPADEILIVGNAIPIRALRGEPVAELQARVEALSDLQMGPLVNASRDEGIAWLAFAEGRYDVAEAHWRAQAEVGDPAMIYARTAAALMALCLGGRDRAAADLAELDAAHLPVPSIQADRMGIVAGLQALDGRTAEALEGLATARLRLVEIGILEEAARFGLATGILLDPAEPAVAAEVLEARAFWDGVGAAPMVAKCDEVLARAGAGSTTEVATA